MNGSELLKAFHQTQAIVFGDLMLDEYIFGRATRVSQEAPVLVVRQQRVSSVPGGAANVAMNIMALGGSVGIIGVVGADTAGKTLEDSLTFSGVQKLGICRDNTRPTTRKTRVMANHSHQVLRVDHESEEPISESVNEQLLEALERSCPGRHVILLSDYQKGAINGSNIPSVIAIAKKHGLKVIANAKPESAPFYRGATAVSLNRFEATLLMGRTKPIEDHEAESVAMTLREKIGVETMIVTLGGSGMVSASATAVHRVPAIKVEVYDEAGAGDTVISTLALAACHQEINRTSLELAAYTAGAVVRKVGVAVPTDDDLRQISDFLR